MERAARPEARASQLSHPAGREWRFRSQAMSPTLPLVESSSPISLQAFNQARSNHLLDAFQWSREIFWSKEDDRMATVVQHLSYVKANARVGDNNAPVFLLFP